MLSSARLLQLYQPQRFLPLHLGRALPVFNRYCSGTESREDTTPRQDNATAAVEVPVSGFVRDIPKGEVREKSTITRSENKSRGRNILRITNAPRHTIVEDILNLLKGTGTQLEDVRLGYDEKSIPTSWFVKFPSPTEGKQAVKRVSPAYMGSRPVQFSFTTQNVWDECNQRFPQPALPQGCSTRVSGLPEHTRIEDVHRFFKDYSLGPNAITMFYSQAPDHALKGRKENARFAMKRVGNKPMLMERHALVRFTSQEEAWRAVREKNRDVLANSYVTVKYLP